MQNFTFEPSLYRHLCIGEKATKQEIRKAYLGLQKVFHPDKNPDSQEWANEQTKVLNLAYGILSNDSKKAEYDRQLNSYLLKQEQERKREEDIKRQEEAKAEQVKPSYSYSSSTSSGFPIMAFVVALIVIVGLVFLFVDSVDNGGSGAGHG